MKHPIDSPEAVATLAFNDDGLVPVVVQEESTGAVLMLAWANADALNQSIATRRMTYWSRSRQAIWTKGETSGNTQALVALAADCDRDAVLAVVEQTGPACHENTGTCWTHREAAPVATILGVLERVAAHRRHAPQDRYTDSLLANPELAAEKIVEEANEVATVLRGLDNEDSLEHEAADLLYHLVVGLQGAGMGLAPVLKELASRH